MSTRRKRVTRRRQNPAAVSWWCLRAGLAALLTVGLLELGSNIPPSWLPRRDALETSASRDQAQETLVFNLRRDFGVSSKLADRIVRAATEASETTKTPLTLLLAVMAVESKFNPAARNRNDVGLMQVNLRYHSQEARDLTSADDLLKVTINIRIGARILRNYMDQEAGNFYAALRRYNGLGKANYYPERVLMAKNHFDRLLARRQLHDGSLHGEPGLTEVRLRAISHKSFAVRSHHP